MEEATQTVRADPCNRAFRAYSFPTEKGKNKTTKQTDNILSITQRRMKFHPDSLRAKR